MSSALAMLIFRQWISNLILGHPFHKDGAQSLSHLRILDPSLNILTTMHIFLLEVFHRSIPQVFGHSALGVRGDANLGRFAPFDDPSQMTITHQIIRLEISAK